MTARAKRGPLIAAVALASLAASLFGAVGLSASASAATTELVFDFDFGTVLPGEVRTAEQTFETPVAAVIAAADVMASAPAEFGVFRSEVCSTGTGCVAFDALPGVALPAGAHTVRVTLEVADGLLQGASLSSTWRLTLVERADELADTGSPAQLGFGAAATLLAIGAGALLVAALRRRKEAER